MTHRLIATLALAGLALTGCVIPQGPGASPGKATVVATHGATFEADLASTGTSRVVPGPKLTGPAALTVLNTLPVKGKAPATWYDRNGKFGNGWKDSDGDRCEERQEALQRDLSKVKFKDSRKCTVASGTLHDRYTGKTINWKVKAGSIDIDHVVALKNAWISGAQKLSQSQRQALANDPLNLISSDASANRSKGDKNAAVL